MSSLFFPVPYVECTAVHRNPEGPNEDVAQCMRCGAPTFLHRPVGESFGWHADDCSLDVNHSGYCDGGGAGHPIPKGQHIRG